MMKEHPILFSAPMVQAIRAKKKTMTRRVMTRNAPQLIGKMYEWRPDNGKEGFWAGTFEHHPNYGEIADGWAYQWCPYGMRGDRLWVRETHHIFAHGDPLIPGGIARNQVVYRADDEGWEVKWRPSIFMPRWASRITLEVVRVRVERLQEITEEDALAEGIYPQRRGEKIGYGCCDQHFEETAVKAFKSLWDSINAARGFSWDSNPWLWVIEFGLSLLEKGAPNP